MSIREQSPHPGQSHLRTKTRDQDQRNRTTGGRQAHKPRSRNFPGGVAGITSTLVSVALLALLAFSASSALAATPWWHVTSGARPTYLHAGVARDEVQELKVNATGGDVLWAVEFPKPSVAFPYNATHEEVQSALEGLYGAGSVAVTGGPVGKPATVTELEPYTVKFVGPKGGQPVSPPVNVFADGGIFGAPGAPLKGTASVSEATKGRPDGEIVASVYNLGDASAFGGVSPMRVADVLPAGLRALSVAGEVPFQTGLGAISSCKVESDSSAACSFEGILAPFGLIEMRVAVEVSGAVSGSNQVSVAGGEGFVCVAHPAGKFTDGACGNEGEPGGFERQPTGPIPAGQVSRHVTISAEQTPFGLQEYELTNEEEGGQLDTQAGSHQFQSTFSVAVNQGPDENPPPSSAKGGTPEVKPAALAKDLNFKLPPGWIGNPSAFPRCPIGAFLTQVGETIACPEDTAMGVATVTIFEPITLQFYTAVAPVFNLEPRPGEPARFGFRAGTVFVYIDSSVRSGSDYGIVGEVHNITQIAGLLNSEVTLWGVPGDARHRDQHGSRCLFEAHGAVITELPVCGGSAQPQPPAFLSLPTSCTGPLSLSVSGDSWVEPGNERELASSETPGLTGCNRLPFSPSIKVTPDVTAASSSTGLTVDVHVPQEETLNANGLAESAPRNITVALPPGVAVNPSGGDGLEACPEGLVGFERFAELPSIPGVQTALFTPTLPEPFCPTASKIGTVTIKTPILQNPIEGAVYLATQNQNPFRSLLALYLVAEDPVSGVLVKLAGHVSLCQSVGEAIFGKTCEALGQLITTFENSPQAPFEDAELHFFGGERAPLSTPPRCGAYTSTASISPWAGGEPVASSSTFQVTSGPNHGPCPGASLPFAPSLHSSSANVDAGAFTPLTTTISREDGQQNMSQVTLHFPPGLSGLLSNVTLCPEQQADEGKCGEDSLIGETIASAGVGSDPVSITGGKVYITEKYHGAPFGLAIVVPPKAGPIDLEHDTSNPAYQAPCDCIVVRAKIEVNPTTAALTVTTNKEGEGYSIPHFLDGVPVQVKAVNVIVNRHDFTFNPTSCDPLPLTGTVAGDEGASAEVGRPFAVTNCAVLKFEPKISVSTQAKTSKADGASLTYKVAYPNVPQGTDADIKYVKVELPKELPSRLTTLQKACTSKQFDANPAGCPKESVIGHAKAIVPNIPVPLEGPVYFVSNGGEAFPNLVMVLQGYGVTIQLVGDTLIKNGVTSTTFNQVPDNPLTSFEINLPEGPYSALAANGNLCKPTVSKTVKKKVRVQVKGRMRTVTRKVKEQVATSIELPNEYAGQNGAVYKYTAPIRVIGCPPTRPKPKPAKKKHVKKHTKKK